MPDDAERIDVGVREVVALLNHIPGVATRASCEGMSPQPARHTHALLAYVAFRHPLPLHVRDFFITHLGALARVDEDGIYCRWPIQNRRFLGSLESATRAYLSAPPRHRQASVRWPLARLRASVACHVAAGRAGEIHVCFTCAQLTGTPHMASHESFAVLRLSADLQDRWFGEFVGRPDNTIDRQLINVDGWVRLLVRTLRGDFGGAFRQRWLRYRAQRIADLTTRQVRVGIEAARGQGLQIDFFHDGTHAVFVLQCDPRQTRGGDLR